MNKFTKSSLYFTAGALGGITNAVFVWGMGAAGISAALGIQIAPAWSPPFLYQRIVWGGLWGFIFILPYFKQSVWLRGTVFGLAPTLVVLTVVLPFQLNQGFLGLNLGALVPLFAIVANAVWGITAVLWLKKTGLE